MKLTQQKQAMEKELQSLLDELCVDLGFCLPPDDQQRLVSADYYDACQFTDEVFCAEKMNPDEHLHLKRQVRQRFTDRFGKSIHLDDFL
jgi:hypothetical protein